VYDDRVLTKNLTFVPADPPRASYFAAWDPKNPGGLGADSTVDVQITLPERRGTRAHTVAAVQLSMHDAIDTLARLHHTDPASESARVWSAAVRTALGLIADGKLLPWVSPDGYDTWRVDPLEPRDHQMLDALVGALPAVAHATTAGRGAIADPAYTIRAFFDAVADSFVRTPAAHRVGSLQLFADRRPTKVPHLRPWVNDIASAHCSSSRLVVRMHPPAHGPPGDAADTRRIDPEIDPLERSLAEPIVDNADEPWRATFALQSRADPSLLVDARDYWMAPTEVVERLGQQAETTLLAGLLTVTRLVEPWADLLDDVAPAEAMLHGADLDLFLDRLDDLEAADIDVRWPSDLVAPKLRRQLVVSAAAPSSGMASSLSLEALLDVDWEFLLDGLPLSAEELRVLAEAKRSVVSLRGRWVRLDRETVHKLRAPAPAIGVSTALAAALGAPIDLAADPAAADSALDPDETIELRVVGALDELVRRLLELSGERMADEPSALHATLRNYQRRGLAWMFDLCELGLGGCLADDMGLGKTIQVLALHAMLTEAGGNDPTREPAPALIVCPTSLMNNWAREAARFLPDVDVRIYHGAGRDLDDLTPDALVVTSYGVVRSDADLLNEIPWRLVVADEAQHAKNPRSRTARSLRRIGHGVRLALTGTPVENNLSELWSILDWAVPGLLGPLETFRRTIALPIERDGDRRATERLQQLVQPFLLRRTKTDDGIAPELPAKIESDLVVPLTDEQVTLYRATTESVLTEVAGAQGIDRRGLILKLLTGLKQITNHPAHYLGEPGPLDGRSGKLDALDDLLANAESAGESTLVFTQYVAMADLIVEHQRVRGRRVAVLHGGLTVGARQELVDRFQAGELTILVLSLKAGGTGLNLTAATNVVHYDRWWNPAVEDQATDRAYRIGQTKAVTVHRIITEGTVEDRVADLLRAKRELADAVTGAGESWIGDLDDADLAELVELSVG